jgi:hypothetical protein
MTNGSKNPDLSDAPIHRTAFWRRLAVSCNRIQAGGAAVTDEERRKMRKTLSDILKSELNPDQRDTLGELEKYGWELRFVRHDPEQRPVPVIFDSEHAKFAVLDQDGSLDEDAFINIRN